MSYLCLEAVSKSYPHQSGPDQLVVDNLNLSITAQEFIVVVGPSGCGKSTLLRMIAGLEQLSAGDIRLAGHSILNKSPKDRNIGMVFQNYALYPHMSVFDNIAYGLKVRKFAKAAIEARVADVASLLDLTHLLERKPRQLSGGQRQRVAMARAMVRHPDLFLFDEPLSNLDAQLRVRMRLEIKKLHERIGATSLYVTHDQSEAMTLADRLVVLHQGKIQQCATPMMIYDEPASVFVASFMGSPPMNLFKAYWDKVTGRITLPGESQTIAHLKKDLLMSHDAPILTLGVRPEHWFVTKTETGLRFQVEWIETLGADLYLCGNLQGQPSQFWHRVRRTHAESLPEIGQWVYLEVQASNWHYFDGQTGKRLP